MAFRPLNTVTNTRGFSPGEDHHNAGRERRNGALAPEVRTTVFAQHKTKWLCLTIVALTALPANAQEPLYRPGQSGFCFHGPGVNMPLGQFLLARKGNQIGALRITRITPDTQTQPSGSEWLGTVAYESYFTDGKQSLATAPHRTASELHFGRMKGFGFHYSWQSGNQYAHVGPWQFLFYSPDGMFTTIVDFWHGTDEDSGLEFAATSTTSIATVDPNDPRLHWFRYDNNREIPCPVSTPPPIHS